MLCDTLHCPSSVSQHHLGYLLDESGQRHVHFHKTSEPRELARASMQSLLASNSSATNAVHFDPPSLEAKKVSPDPADIPSAPIRSIKLRKRLRLGETFGVAAVLSSSLLQMHTTPWITERWNGTDIQFLHPEDQRPASTCMYLHRQYHSPISRHPALRQEKQHDTAETRENRDEIFSLGIMLLELLYESLFSEQEALFTDGGDTDCYSRQIAAAAWLEDIPRNSDFHLLKYDKIVQYCLECNFGVGFGSINICLWNGDFREAMYSHVVEPLERLARIASSR
jgi:hypothetical protein